MLYFYIDQTYLMLVLPALVLAMWAQAKVRTTFAKYSRVGAHSGLTGRQAAQRVLDANGVTGIRFEHIAGSMTDHYDPRGAVIRLSDTVDSSNSVAAIGVACHEAGHAVQYARGYAPIRLRTAIIPVCSIGSQLSIPVVLLGAFMGRQGLINFGLLLFATVALFQLVTLPVEFDASRRAIAALDGSGMLEADELYGAKRVLSAAAMTYVAALITSIASLLRLLILFGGRNRD